MVLLLLYLFVQKWGDDADWLTFDSHEFPEALRGSVSNAKLFVGHCSLGTAGELRNSIGQKGRAMGYPGKSAIEIQVTREIASSTLAPAEAFPPFNNLPSVHRRVSAK